MFVVETEGDSASAVDVGEIFGIVYHYRPVFGLLPRSLRMANFTLGYARLSSNYRRHTPSAPRLALRLTDRKQLISSIDRKGTRLNSSHIQKSRMPSSA